MGGEYKRAYSGSASTLSLPGPKLAYMAAPATARSSALAERLIEARIASGYTVPKQAADAAGITPAALYQLENGTTRSLRAETAEKLAAIYPAFRIGWLISGSEPKFNPAMGVKDSQARYAASQSLRIDPDTIAAAIKLVRLSFLNLGLEIDQELNGLPLAVAYEFLMQRDERGVTGENVVAFGPVLARKLKEQHGDQTREGEH